jgi:hypothetical protein
LKEPITHSPRIEHIYKGLDEYFQRHGDLIRDEVKQFEQKAAENHLRYAGKSLLVAFYPFILSEEQVRHISAIAEATIRLMEKVTRLFLQEPAIREYFPFSEEQLELIEVEPGYRLAIPCARFDSFYDGANLRFSELNTDGSSGMDGADRIAKIYLSSPSIKEFFFGQQVSGFEINQAILDTLLSCYREFIGIEKTDRPRIAIVDWRGVRTSEEFAGFQEFCRERAYEVLVADPRELDYDGRSLSHGGVKIDIIYRRVVSREYVQRLDEVKAMTRAFKDHNVCVVGSFRSDVAFSKKVFALVRDRRLERYFTEEERRLAAEHIPWTASLDDAEYDCEGRRVNIPELAKGNKNDFVLKPSYLYEGRGVKVGALTPLDEWEKLADSAIGNDYVLQERIRIPTMPIALWNEEMRIEQRLIHLGEFVFGGRFCGLYCRAADTLVIDRRSREFLVPCLVMA